MTDQYKELRRLAEEVKGWSNCNRAWLDHSEDTPAAVVGHIDEDGETYPVAIIDYDQQYCAAHQSLLLAKFYAAANPAAILSLIDRLEAAERDAARYRFVRTADRIRISTKAARDPVAYDEAIDAAIRKESES